MTFWMQYGVMNFVINRLDNLDIGSNSYEFIPENVKKELQIAGGFVGTNGRLHVNQKDVMLLIKNSDLRSQIGENMYNALFRKPMLIFFKPTLEDELEASKEELDQKYGLATIHLNNFAQAFSLGCWFLKDSCVCSEYIYWVNMFNGYNAQSRRDMSVTLSNGQIKEISLTKEEMKEALERMHEVYAYLLPDESAMGKVEMTNSAGTIIWNIDNVVSMEGKSFARALILLQEARRTGVISAKIEKYCSVLECIYAIKEQNKKNIAEITAAYLGKDDAERNRIKDNMRTLYGVRSDDTHGSNIKYLQTKSKDELINLSVELDDYVRNVLRKAFSAPELNYKNTSEDKARVRKIFKDLIQTSAGV